MAKSVSLRPANANVKAGQPAEPSFRIPPPAVMPAGITSGTPPLPVGRAVKMVDPTKLLPSERKALERAGWVEGQPIPQSIAPALQQMEAAAKADHAQGQHMLAVDPNTPPTRFSPIPIEQLPAVDQARYNQILDEALTKAAADAEVDEPEVQPSLLDQNLRVIETVPEQLERPAPPFVPPNQRKPAPVAGNPKARPPQPAPVQPKLGEMTEPPEPQIAAVINRTETPVAPMTHCPHCRWNLADPDQPEPDIEDKQTYLQSVLGEIPYVRTYPILGGAVTVTFRTLTTKEIDACFQQCFKEEKEGKIVLKADFFERLNRFRLYLQLMGLRSNTFFHDLPDGLDEVANSNATAFWETDPGHSALEQIENFILTNVLKTETLNRVIQQQANRFNRLVGRLEALVDNSDFWKATEAAS